MDSSQGRATKSEGFDLVLQVNGLKDGSKVTLQEELQGKRRKAPGQLVLDSPKNHH